ncbi:unnamed protein product [Vitrella brassicaformis CCMP3155]|uniref:Photolyase/cryptochrome alpha/beta domain-containing protein n=1 Tax=Vitrella brassicaformis (strain CCMP3155) TaxID=1169540 RepID=A0A0G4GX81_VITBC|nr:unnamed protein product [Vitrella brassicaformis CCMP3155]|eukprot:CEM35645.1 unnamed protein product [Vitrella brassicaformis CCMP3155]
MHMQSDAVRLRAQDQEAAAFLSTTKTPLSTAPRERRGLLRMSAAGRQAVTARNDLPALATGGSSLVVYSLTDLRVHDHPALYAASQQSDRCIPVFIFDPAALDEVSPTRLQLLLSALSQLRDALRQRNSDLFLFQGDTQAVIGDLIASKAITDVLFHDSPEYAQQRWKDEVMRAAQEKGAAFHAWSAPLRPLSTPTSALPSSFPAYAKRFRKGKVMPPLPAPATLPPAPPNADIDRSLTEVPSFVDALKLTEESIEGSTSDAATLLNARIALTPESALFGFASGRPPSLANGDSIDVLPSTSASSFGEASALAKLDEYITMGDLDFAKAAIKSTANSTLSLEQRSVQRMAAKSVKDAYFRGEAFTRAFAESVGFGCLSLREIASARRRRRAVELPLRSIEREYVEWKEWHRLLAYQDISPSPPSSLPRMSWSDTPLETRYYHWRGFLVRYIKSATQHDPAKPKVLLVHGFGASADQWRKTMAVLQQHYEVFAIDMLGFGHSEKPRLTFTQYTWESLLRDFVLEVVRGPYYVAGNSIGGYMAQSLAADTRDLCRGTILLNSAGRVFTPAEYVNVTASLGGTMEEATRGYAQPLPPYSAPPERLLQLFATGLYLYLKTQTPSICKRLYPTNGTAVEDGIIDCILRDSADPGAIGVIASGAKLPPQRSHNELIAKFGRPVLILQGLLDPLNNATARMEAFQRLGDLIETAPLPAGHCPHDELPTEVANEMVKFIQRTEAKPVVSSGAPPAARDARERAVGAGDSPLQRSVVDENILEDAEAALAKQVVK